MVLSKIKIFLSVIFWALSMSARLAYACDLGNDLVIADSYVTDECIQEGEPGSSSYVDLTETVFAVEVPSGLCAEESDGDWSADGKEGLSFNDHPDDQPTSNSYSWIIFEPIIGLVFDMTSPRIPSINPGATCPPPQV